MWIEAFALKMRLKPTSTLFKVCLILICILPCNNHKSHVVRFYRHPTSQVGKLRFSNVGILAPSSSSTSVLTLGPLAEASAFSDSFVSLSSKPQRYDPCLQHPHLWVKGQAPKAPPAAIHTILSYLASHSLLRQFISTRKHTRTCQVLAHHFVLPLSICLVSPWSSTAQTPPL